MGTPHIGANKGDFAKVVLMPGDPRRAKWIAENFLHDAVLVNDVRGILGYTGYTKNGKRVSVMASGMGQPSIGIYSHELYTEFDVETIIRVGTCGGYSEKVDLRDILVASTVSTDSNWASQFEINGTLSAGADFDLCLATYEVIKEKGYKAHFGNILSSDVFYDYDKNAWKKWEALGVLGVEMESYALYMNAVVAKKKALCILTCSDHFTKQGILTAEERQEGLRNMIDVAICVAEKYSD